MYINFKSKYKKFFWLLLGFMLSCVFVHNVEALESVNYHGYMITDETYDRLWEKFDNKTYHEVDSSINSNEVIHREDFPYVQIYGYRSGNNLLFISFNFLKDYHISCPGSEVLTGSSAGEVRYFCNNSQPYFNQYWLSISMWISDDRVGTPYVNNSIFVSYTQTTPTFYSALTNFDVYTKSHRLALAKNYNYEPSSIPDYLQGYTKVTLEPGERYVMFSSSTITSGSVYIPISDFNDYGSRISYFDNDIDTQPYTSYIQDFTTTSDGLYAKQDFDLSTYTGSDFIMFSKYIYLEGPDDFSSSVWVPNEMYSSIVEVTPNNTGGNDFDFSYVDENGELQANVISSSDLSQGSPLLSDLFTNFTTKDYGLSSIITAPIPLLQTLNNSSCSTVDLPLGVFGGVHDQKLSLPCMTPLYSSTFGQLFTLYQTITTGLVAYFIGLAYFNKIKQLKDPDNDKIEVVDL